jgi:hypothetical protein
MTPAFAQRIKYGRGHQIGRQSSARYDCALDQQIECVDSEHKHKAQPIWL